MPRSTLSRRSLLQAAAASLPLLALAESAWPENIPSQPLEEFPYSAVRVTGSRQLAQRENVTQILMGLDEDSLLQPFRQMAGQPAPGVSLGGWYEYKADYNYHHDDAGLSPGSTLGQWISALARLHAATGETSSPFSQRVHRLTSLLNASISADFFARTRFPAYTYDKLVCGLVDAHRLTADPNALATLDNGTAAAQTVLPGRAIDREIQWKLGADLSWMWDESYTLPENLYLASTTGAGSRYRKLAQAYLDDATYFEPLARGVNLLADKHAYSYVNALCSAMQAWFVDGSEMHLRAARNGFNLLQAQSFATGGWGPDELLRKPGSDDLAKSLTASHNGFETPCGGYAHMKLTRYLLRATRDGRYGDSMERVLHNTVLGVLPLQADGRSFYNSDYNDVATKVYSVHRWPCCSGTLPQVVSDYGINTYLHAPGEIWVNLYQPSVLETTVDATSVRIEQMTRYPQEPVILLHVTTSRPVAFALRLRIPAWSSAATLRVNGRPFELSTEDGFTVVSRRWRSGDTVELTLPMALRLEPLAANGGPPNDHLVAVLRGPLVLFLLRDPGETGPARLSREALLQAQQTGPMEWTVASSAGPRRFLPFSEIDDRPYTTYITLTPFS